MNSFFEYTFVNWLFMKIYYDVNFFFKKKKIRFSHQAVLTE